MTPLSILADLINAVVWIVSTRLHHSKYPQSLYQYFDDWSKTTNYNWYHRHFYVPLFFFFQFPKKFQVVILLFAFFQFYCPGQQSPLLSKIFIIIIIIIYLLLDSFTEVWVTASLLKSPGYSSPNFGRSQ